MKRLVIDYVAADDPDRTVHRVIASTVLELPGATVGVVTSAGFVELGTPRHSRPLVAVADIVSARVVDDAEKAEP